MIEFRPAYLKRPGDTTEERVFFHGWYVVKDKIVGIIEKRDGNVDVAYPSWIHFDPVNPDDVIWEPNGAFEDEDEAM